MLLGTVVVAVAVLLGLNLLVTGGFGADETTPAGSAAAVPQAARGGPVLDARDDHPLVLRPLAKTVALTFDDGQDKEWTPLVRETL